MKYQMLTILGPLLLAPITCAVTGDNNNTTRFLCATDDDCSLNGICCPDTGTCECDPGWTSDDCGKLDLMPAARWTGYNHTDNTTTNADVDGVQYYGTKANSSWGGQILRDRADPGLYHLIASQFSHGCGLSGWRPFSKVIRAESRTGPAGPYLWAQDVLPAFRHNPAVIWSPADQLYLLYTIGVETQLPHDSCKSYKWANNISVSSAPDLCGPWTEPEVLLNGTNPTPWPLWEEEDGSDDDNDNNDQGILLGAEDGLIYKSDTSSAGPYNLINTMPWNTSDFAATWTEDPFLWRDKRGNWHMLAHWMIDISESGLTSQKYPRVGAHFFSRSVDHGWTFKLQEAFNTTVMFTDGGRTDYYRRERPKLFFSDDGELTPLMLINGVQEFGVEGRSYTLVQPVGKAGAELL